MLIDYMLWFMVSFGFVFYFNWLPYILNDFKGLRGSFSGIFNWLCLHFNWLHILAFGFWVKMMANLIDYYVILIDYLHVFCV